jgi:hypothetical protein
VSVKEIYQTLEDKGNPNQVEAEGPFKCPKKLAWLGSGYYFWESFVENAHWWGRECNTYSDGYIVCKAYYDLDQDLCFNLIDNPIHIKKFRDTIELMKAKKLYNKNTTVPRIINYLKDTLGIFKFDASRVYGVHSKNKKSKYTINIPFKQSGQQYLDLLPAIQICFYKKKALNLRDYKIIYPDEYIDGYAV